MQLGEKVYKVLVPAYEKAVVQKSEPGMFPVSKVCLTGSESSSY